MPHLKVVAFGAVSAGLAAIAAKMFALCPDLIHQWPSVLVAGIAAGVGYNMTSPHDKEPEA